MTSKEQKISLFNPNDPAHADAGLFGLPFTEEESDIVVFPVPWEVTVSYRSGTARAPEAIMAASAQVDLFDPDSPDGWKRGIFMKAPDRQLRKKNKELRKKAIHVIGDGNRKKKRGKTLKEINEEGLKLKELVQRQMTALLESNKLPVLLGGDHSTPLGFLYALAGKYSSFGILQIDAHCDLRNAYEGFEYSHASIMFQALKLANVSRLVQVGIRDWCEEEEAVIRSSQGRVTVFFDHEMKQEMYSGIGWKNICERIVSALPSDVYISFDIDGLDPKLCPGTGTPVPGGLEFEQAVMLIKMVVDSGRKIIGCDLCEVVPGTGRGDSWDAMVGARMLYKLCNLMGNSRKVETR